ncbi:B3 domain-containing transcription factor VRN1-like isoform X2 [Benincasa hispida]|uniref:B3 domain-containing transcription factor VRN1-like isoform X2 n=1 Tax=Benincasa hispida TaxID=102211 RepID=UPI00190291C7|nr:B3 domain-containing transcription factor VRN1-like isoform X2 [Benincasa hispida]
MALFSSPNPHFFKIILHQNLIQQKLDLPNKFVKNNGASLLFSKATLSLPDGANWTVQLKNLDGKICFLRGWPEFVEFYSIQPGYFLVFQLRRICCFNVLIFDTSATEIDYPTRPPSVLIPKTENEDGEESVRTLNGAVLKKRSREKEEKTVAYCSFREMKKMMRKNVKIKIEKHRGFTTSQGFSYEDEDEDEDLETNYSRRQSTYRGSAYNEGDDGRFSPETMRPMNPRKTPPVLTENQLVVLRRARSFKCRTNNPSFMVTMRPSYIQTGNYLSIPRIFAERYIKESMDVKLEIGDGRSWRVLCGVRWAFTRRRTELKGGWKRFAVDNELEEGDICVFELINKTTKVHFHVTIFRLPSPE